MNGRNSDHFHIKHSSMVVHPLHSWERNLQNSDTYMSGLLVKSTLFRYQNEQQNWKLWYFKVCKVLYKTIAFLCLLIYYSSFREWHILHQVTAQNRIVGAFPEIQANRSVLFSGGHSAAWGSTTKHQTQKTKSLTSPTHTVDSKCTRYMCQQCNDQNAKC